MAMERRPLERSVHEACSSSPEGADLIVNVFVQALMSYRRASVCKPFPNSIFSKSNSNEEDYASAMEAIQQIPRIQNIRLSKLTCQELEDCASNGSTSYSGVLQELSFKSLRLLHWLLRFGQHVELVLDPSKEFFGLLTKRFSPWNMGMNLGTSKALLPEYVLKIKGTKDDDPLSNFSKIRDQFGSFFAFHGTAAENLYSILRCGLLNMSRTQMQRNGAVFGEGIYFSLDPNVALGFSTAGKGWDHSCFGERQKYVLLCEVANGEGVLCSDGCKPISKEDIISKGQLQPRHNSNAAVPKTYIIVQNVDLVKIRYIFVYCEAADFDSAKTEKSLHTQNQSLRSSQGNGWMMFLRSNLFKIGVLLYILLLLCIAFKNSGTGKHRKRSIFWG